MSGSAGREGALRNGWGWGLLTLAFLTASCSSPPRESLGSVLWMQTSSEYRAASMQTYRAAERQLRPALEDKSWAAATEQAGDLSALPPAVILDVDETVLDNSRYLAHLVLEGKAHRPEVWDEWVRMRSAPAVPGSVVFVRSAWNLGVTPIYITNRRCSRRAGADDPCPQERDTMETLRAAGFPPPEPDHVLLRGERPSWGADKSSRRAHVGRRYRILMLVGDNLGDFIPVARQGSTPEERSTCAGDHHAMWGHKWFVLPNPAYGSWRRILKEPVSECLHGFDLPDGEE